MRCVIYRRVSTDMQAEQGYSLDAQKERLEAYAISQGWTIVHDYCDDGYSAKTTERPQMQQLIKAIKNKEFDLVLVYKLDRFVRSVLDLHELLQIMDEHNVKFKSATEVFDTTSATGRLFITLIATLAQWERETIAERVQVGMTKKVEQGERAGGQAPFGYDSGENGKLILNEEEAKWVKYIFDRYKKVGSLVIARELNKKGIKTKKGFIWSDNTVRYTLKNHIYYGGLRWNYASFSSGKRKLTGNEIYVDIQQDDFVPIISKEQFDDTQKLFSERYNMAFKAKNAYPYSGILKCPKCNSPFAGNSKTRRNHTHRFYKCQGRFKQGICDHPIVPEKSIDVAFLKILNIVRDEIEIEEDVKKEVIDIDKALSSLQKRKERAEELYIDGEIERKRYEKIVNDIKKEELETLTYINLKNKKVDVAELRALIDNLIVKWDKINFESRKSAISSLFKSIVIKIDKHTITGSSNNLAEVSIIDYEMK